MKNITILYGTHERDWGTVRCYRPLSRTDPEIRTNPPGREVSGVELEKMHRYHDKYKIIEENPCCIRTDADFRARKVPLFIQFIVENN